MKSLCSVLITVCLYFTSLNADTEKLIILGSGPAGLTAAIFAGQLALNPLVIEGEDCSQIFSIYKIENYPGFPKGIEGKELHERMRQQAESFNARFYSGHVAEEDLNSWPFHLKLLNGEEMDCESLIIATGSSPRWLGLESERALIGKGVSANALVDAPNFYNKEVVVVGGGDSAMEQALLLVEYASKVTIIYKRNAIYASPYLQERVFNNPKISILLETDVVDIHDVSLGVVTEIVVQEVNSKKEKIISCEGVFIANGRQPNTQIFKGNLEINKEGYFVSHPGTTETNIPGVFVIGDIAFNPYRKVITATASGCMSAIDVARFFKERQSK